MCSVRLKRSLTLFQRRYFIAALICAFLAGCSLAPSVPVDGQFLGYPVQTAVDSKIVKFYIEDYFVEDVEAAQSEEASENAKKIDQIYHEQGTDLPSREQLQLISQEYSIDFASLFFVDRLLADNCTAQVNQEYQQFLSLSQDIDPELASSAMVLFVPGWNYLKKGDYTGANFASSIKVAAENNIEHALVPVLPVGSVEQNAQILAEQIRSQISAGKPLILVGASSAAPAIHMVLGDFLTESERSSVLAWVNVGGILQGTPLVDRFQSWPQRGLLNLVAWWNGWSTQAILSMNTENSRRRFSEITPFQDILILNYLGVPLSGQLTKYAKGTYSALRSYGPNDGLTLLPDAIAPNSLTIIDFGADHFFTQGPDMQDKTLALIKLVFEGLPEGNNCKYP